MSYASFAQYYDSLTQNVEYARRAEYLCALMEHLGHRPGLTLDGCTGRTGNRCLRDRRVCGHALCCKAKSSRERPGPVVSVSKNAKTRPLWHGGYGDLCP